MGYGFSLFENSADRFAMALTQYSDRNSADEGSQYSNASRLSSPKLSNIHYLNLPANTALSCCSMQLVQALHAMVANNREGTMHHESIPIDITDRITTHQKARVVSKLMVFLQSKYSTITVHNRYLPPWPMNEKQFHAARYRRSQLRILKIITGRLAGILQRMIDQPDPQFIRLDHILSRSPGSFITDFRSLLHHGIGTRKPTKIRSLGLEHLVYTIWLCSLRLHHELQNRDDRNVDTNQWHFDLRCWTSFLDEVYGQPFDVDQSKRSESEANLANSISESYLEVIQAAAQRHVQSMYSDPRWTIGFVRWGYYIVQEESFTCPGVHSKGGSEDELILFLESPNTED